jgi:hypothetical protein
LNNVIIWIDEKENMNYIKLENKIRDAYVSLKQKANLYIFDEENNLIIIKANEIYDLIGRDNINEKMLKINLNKKFDELFNYRSNKFIINFLPSCKENFYFLFYDPKSPESSFKLHICISELINQNVNNCKKSNGITPLFLKNMGNYFNRIHSYSYGKVSLIISLNSDTQDISIFTHFNTKTVFNIFHIQPKGKCISIFPEILRKHKINFTLITDENIIYIYKASFSNNTILMDLSENYEVIKFENLNERNEDVIKNKYDEIKEESYINEHCDITKFTTTNQKNSFIYPDLNECDIISVDQQEKIKNELFNDFNSKLDQDCVIDSIGSRIEKLAEEKLNKILKKYERKVLYSVESYLKTVEITLCEEKQLSSKLNKLLNHISLQNNIIE